MKKGNWIWMPHSAHLIVGDDCKFHLATYVGEYLVSTVGEYWPDRIVREIHAEVYDKEWFEKNRGLKGDYFNKAYMERFGFEDIGSNRKYETYVFKAKKMPKEGCKACLYTARDWEELDSLGSNEAQDAYKNHLKLCKKWSEK